MCTRPIARGVDRWRAALVRHDPGLERDHPGRASSERPETQVTDRSGHMGNAFRRFGGGMDALDNPFGPRVSPM